ncbi:MAG: cyclopropane-fatty-acyl-phospholipid synthase family protein [Desulfofustis sp.]|nr:cyclopropane-fatty-acyl-phospholipid synthase family protein [Desulfofustis sp.]
MNGITTISGQNSVRLRIPGTAGWSRTMLINSLSRIEYGRILIKEGQNRWIFGKHAEPCAQMTIHDPTAYRKIIFGGSIGAAEAYIDGLWDVDDLTALMRIMVGNMELLDKMEKGTAWLLKPFDLVRHLLSVNSRAGARKNILAHYDLGNDLYRSFLDSKMIYSSAIYPGPDSTLEESQLNKLDILCRKLDLQPGDSVIEIGSGWGGFALHAAATYGCHVTTTTISDAQYKEAARRIEDAGLKDRISLLKQDYRDLTGSYDKLVSVEMIEAVGHRNMPVFFRKCGELLKPGGTMVHQAITIADQKYRQYLRGVDFIQRYIFPGGCLTSLSRMVRLVAEQTDMVVRQLDDFGHDYARTLRDWRSRFDKHYPLLKKKGYDERFKRLWDFYLSYCEGGFVERSISVVHLVADRPPDRLR